MVGRQCLATQNQANRLVLEVHDNAPRLSNLIRIARTQHYQIGNGPQARNLLYRLVRWPIFADPD